jgi:hypothetical protein
MRNKNGTFAKKHDLSKIREYNIWGNMLYRCNTPSCKLYKNYGGRGIKVCDDWLIFDNFIKDMGFRPTVNHSLDRIDVDGDYNVSNCRWATNKQQSRNRTNSVLIHIDGLSMQIDDYCEKYNLSKHAIKNRVRRGWSNDRIIKTPIKVKKC